MTDTLYLICCSVRTGSTLLQWMLRDAGCGDAHEYLHGNNPICDTYAEYAWHIRNGNRRTPGIIGWRVMWGQFWKQQELKPHIWHAVAPEMMMDGVIDAVGADAVCYIHLTRRDRRRQAASFIRAEYGHRWYCPADDNPRSIDIPMTPEIIERYEWLIGELPKYDRMWEGYFSARGIDPLRLAYEDMTASETAIRQALQSVIEYIGGDPSKADTVPVSLRKQSGDDVERWLAAYENL